MIPSVPAVTDVVAMFEAGGGEVVPGLFARTVRRTMPRQPLMLTPRKELLPLLGCQLSPDVSGFAHVGLVSTLQRVRGQPKGWTPSDHAVTSFSNLRISSSAFFSSASIASRARGG